MMEWQPIETAPKSKKTEHGVEGVYILGFCPEPDMSNLESCICVVWWEPNMKGGKGMWYGEGGVETHPTHWMHLPSVPSAQQPTHDTPIRFFCHSEDAGYNEFDTLDKAVECADSMLDDARGNAQLDGEWREEETAIRYGTVIGEAVEVRTDEGSYEYFISRPGSHPPEATCNDLPPGA